MNEKIVELVAYLRKITGFKSLSIPPFLLKGQIGIRRFSTNENFTLSEFCETYKIEVEQKELSPDDFVAADTYNSLKINEFKNAFRANVRILHKHRTKKISSPCLAHLLYIGEQKRYANLLIINYLWARTYEESFFGANENFVYLCRDRNRKKKASKYAVPLRTAYLEAISTK
jgi:hypothetical protein